MRLLMIVATGEPASPGPGFNVVFKVAFSRRARSSDPFSTLFSLLMPGRQAAAIVGNVFVLIRRESGGGQSESKAGVYHQQSAF